MTTEPLVTSLRGNNPMSKTLPSRNVTQVERTFRIERETPSNGEYMLRIHRETITRDESGNALAVEQYPGRYDEPVSKTVTRKSAETYLVACQSAKTISDLMAAESAFYDSLVDEVDAEEKSLKEKPPVA